jgi:hypothetical protein
VGAGIILCSHQIPAFSLHVGHLRDSRYHIEPTIAGNGLADLAGGEEDEQDNTATRQRVTRRDSTALTVEVEVSTIRDELVRRLSYRVVEVGFPVNFRSPR